MSAEDPQDETNDVGMTAEMEASAETEAEPAQRGKGRPTPKRKDRQARNTGPVAPPPTTRKEAKKRRREKRKEEIRAGRPERPTGGDVLLPRDQGPVRAMVRDLIDGRRNMTMFVLPVLLLYVIAALSQNDRLLNIIFPIYIAALVLTLFDAITIRSLIKRAVRERFPNDTQKGHAMYGLLRAVSFRRLRAPKPRVSPPPLFGKRS